MSEPRYRPIQRLEAGGMAEVFLAEATSVQGFRKKVAIKRVLPHLAQNKNFIGMFLDEARLGAKLNHTNIVTVFDIGAADNTFFIVMEFVDGCNLKKVIEVLRQRGRSVPVKEAVFIAMEACRGLNFAHDLTDDEGEILNIVHRDVSPPNILISKRGEVKVTDFGLAKATTQLEKTDPGVVKGKFSYLSPEAAMGKPVDARADVFAMGIVLWEMLAGRRLFLGETDYQTVKLVQQAQVPSISRVNPEVDSELEAVLEVALTQDPADRYQSAREFADALAGYLFSHKMKVTSYDIAALVKTTLADDDGKPKGPQQQSIIDRLIQDELLRFTSLDDKSDIDFGTDLSPDGTDGARPLDAGSFENPADWFADDDLAAGDAPLSTDSGSGWVESGVESNGRRSVPPQRRSLPPATETDPLPAPRPAVPASKADSGPTPANAPVAAATAPTPAESGGMGGKLVVGALVAMAIGGAVVYVLSH